MKSILIVDDDRMILESVSEVLSKSGYRVFTAEKSKQVESILDTQTIHLVILDIQLDEETGYTVCKKIRRKTEVPVLFLTAYEGEDELVRAFQSGGDDYLTKPFRLRELLVRVEALLRRSNEKAVNVLKSEFLTIEREGRGVYLDGKLCELTDIESKIVLCLMENYPGTVPKRNLEEYVWGIDSTFVDRNTINVHISRLREKLGRKELIYTVHGRGYRWNAKVERW